MSLTAVPRPSSSSSSSPPGRPGRPSVRATFLLALAALLAPLGCTDDDGADRDGAHPAGSTTTAPASSGSGSDAGADDLPTVMGKLDLRPLREVPGEWTSIRSLGSSLYAYRPLPNGNQVLGRFAPGTGELLAERELPDWSNYTVTEDGIVMMRAPARRVDVLDLDDLSDRLSIPLPEGRPDLNADLPRTGPFWIGIRQTSEGQLSGAPARMAIARLDLKAGTVAEIRDVTACGAKSAAQIDDRRVAFVVECAYQPAVLDLQTGEETAFDGFPDGAHTFAVGDTAWFRWKPLGYLARLRGDELRTLDLNADGPVIVDIQSAFVHDGDTWVVGDVAFGGDRRVLFRIDAERFEVEARAWIDAQNIAFVDGVGYAAVPGGIARFDPDDVVGGAPREVVRPAPGLPPEVSTDDPAELAVLVAFRKVFDPAVPAEEAAAAFDDPTIADLRAGLVELTETVYPGVRLRPTAVAVDGDEAAVNYVLERDGKLAFVPVSTTLRRDGDRWLVTRDGVCRLVELAAIPGC